MGTQVNGSDNIIGDGNVTNKGVQIVYGDQNNGKGTLIGREAKLKNSNKKNKKKLAGKNW